VTHLHWKENTFTKIMNAAIANNVPESTIAKWCGRINGISHAPQKNNCGWRKLYENGEKTLDTQYDSTN